MAKQNFGAGSGVPDPPRQGEKGGKGGTIKKEGRSMRPGEKGSNESGGTNRANKADNPSGKGSGNR